MYNKEKIIRAIIGIIFLLLLYLENLSKKIIDIRAINALTNIEIIVLFIEANSATAATRGKPAIEPNKIKSARLFELILMLSFLFIVYFYTKFFIMLC